MAPRFPVSWALACMGLFGCFSASRCRSKDIPPSKSFPPEEIYGSYNSKSLPPGKDFLVNIFPQEISSPHCMGHFVQIFGLGLGLGCVTGNSFPPSNQ